ncbi:MAG: DHHW family protein [Oscillospiraceae bacterium]|nr:DHHW family protein [Oscillospiraceae bacterium]
MKSMNNLHKKLSAAFFFAFIGLIPVISLIVMPKEAVVFSEIENRYLARFPQLSVETVLNNEFMKGFEDWADDRVVGRVEWIKLRNNLELALNKTEISGVFITDERLMQIWAKPDYDSIDKTLNAVNSFAERHSETPVYFMLAPTSLGIYADTLPPSAPVNSQRDFIKYCYEYLAEVTPIDVATPLEEHREHYIYYRTDHHMTSLGSYISYTAAAPILGERPLEMGRFNIENVSNSFLGTLYSLTLNDRVTPDVISVYTLSDGDPAVTVTKNDGPEVEAHPGLYFEEFLEVKDKYSYFLGPNSPLVEITSDSATTEKRLLLFKDSYAHSLVPFLAKNYKHITMVDMRYINSSYRRLFNVEDYDAVLFVYNVITFSEDTGLLKLNAGR